MRIFIFLILLACLVRVSAEEQPRRFWGEAWRGWHFYEEPDPDDSSTSAPRQPTPAVAAPKPIGPLPRAPELMEFERLQKALEEARKIAIVRPTEANVRRYMEMESKVFSQASSFADVAQRVSWAYPELDPSLRGRPMNAKAVEVFDQEQAVARSRTAGELGRDHVLIFFFRSDCPYCHALAPTLLTFQTRHGIKVEAVSIDGGPIPGFPAARRDNGVATALQVTQVPAVYLAQPFTGRIVPLGFGVLSEAQLLERVTAVSAPGYEAMVPSAVRQIAGRK